MKKYSRIVAVLLGIVLIGLVSLAYIVPEDKYVVVKEFGKIVRIVDEPGLYFKKPFIQSTDYMTKRVLHFDSEPTDVLTLDKKKLFVDNYAMWRIADPKEFLKTVQTRGNAERRLEASTYSVVRNVIATLKFEEVISEDSTRGDFNQEITKRINEQLQQFGMEVVDVRIKRTDLPTANTKSVYDRMISERDKIAAAYLSEGERRATEIKAETDKDVKVLLSEAKAQAKAIEGEGEGEAARIYAEAYNLDPEFYRFIRTMESYKKTLNGEPTIVIPIDSDYAKYLMGEK